MHRYRNRQRALWLLAATLLLAFTAAFVFVSWYGWSESGRVLVPESRRAALLGLSGMVLLFVVYGLAQQRRLADLEDELRQAELREETMRARFEELEVLFEASQELGAGMELGGLLDLAARRLRRGLEADACAIHLLDADGARLVAAATCGPDETARTLPPVGPGEGVVGLVHLTGEAMVVDTGPLLGQLAIEMDLERSPGGGLCVPLRIGNRALGVASVIRFDPESPYVQAHSRMVAPFARTLARAIGSARAGESARAA